MIEDFFKLVVRNIRRRKLRSWLTMICIFVGIAAVVSLVSLGQGLKEYTNEEFEKLGRDKIFVQPKGSLGGPGTGGAVRTAQRGKETEVRRPASLLAPYEGPNVSAGVRALRRTQRTYQGRNVGTIKKLP